MITISDFSNTKSTKGYIFSDIDFNFDKQKTSANSINNDVTNKNDISIDYDENAIRNSIRNILTQKRHLSDAGVNIIKYIGEPLSQDRAILIGEEIDKAIFLYEPRIGVDKIYVGVDPTQTAYLISMKVRIHNLRRTESQLNAYLTNTGVFDFVNN